MKTRLFIGLVLLAACGGDDNTDSQLGNPDLTPQPRTGVVKISPDEIWVTEGSPQEVTISLTEAPSDGLVTLTFTSENPDRLTVPATLAIADKTPVKLAITVPDNDVVDKAARARIQVAVNGDGNYAQSPNLSFFANADDDEVPTGTVTPDALTLSEGGSADISAVLGTLPSEDVRLTFTPSRPNVVVTPKTLVFTPDNYDVPQPTTVSAIDLDFDPTDLGLGGDEDGPVTIVVTARGSGYERIDVNNVTVTTDGAPVTPTLAIAPDALSLTKDPPTDGEVAITLNVDPIDPVTITPTFDAALIDVTPTDLTLDSTNFGDGGAFTVTAINSGTAGEETTSVTFTVDTTGVYSGATLDAVDVTLTEN